MAGLQERIALVTGAAGGLGRATAARLAEAGAHVVVSDIDAAAATATAAALKETGASVAAVALDVTSAASVAAALAAIASTHGRLDILVNNAGLNAGTDFRSLTDEEWMKVRGVNLDGVVRLARDAFPLLKASGRGVIVNVSSVMASRKLRGLAAYSATKAAVSSLSKSLAVEYAPFSIRVNAVAPGFVQTALTGRALRNPMVRKALVDKTALKRLGTPEDIAAAVLFLVSDDAAYITGADLAVDGGMSAGLSRTMRAKRLFDLAVVALLSPLIVVVLAALALAVRLNLGAPVFFTQVRPGLGGRPFRLIKFRTMTDARDAAGVLLPDGERLTRFGRLLRSSSLDELPELLNVIGGDMSLVGPRPLLMEYLPLYDATQTRRHEVPPGLTGWAQVNGRNALSWEERFALDVWYVDNRSLWLDMRVLVATVRAVLAREGISAADHATMPKFEGTGKPATPPPSG